MQGRSFIFGIGFENAGRPKDDLRREVRDHGSEEEGREAGQEKGR